MTPELTATLNRARTYQMTPREKFEQRVSFVFSGCGDDVSKSDVRRMLCKHGGYPTEWGDAK